MPPIWLLPFLTALFEAFSACNEDSSKSKTRKRLRKPGRREIRGTAIVLRREGGFRGWELRAKTYEAIATLENATDRDIDNFMACGTASYIED